MGRIASVPVLTWIYVVQSVVLTLLVPLLNILLTVLIIKDNHQRVSSKSEQRTVK